MHLADGDRHETEQTKERKLRQIFLVDDFLRLGPSRSDSCGKDIHE